MITRLVCKSAAVREFDRHAVTEIGIPGLVLMENAGVRICSDICERLLAPGSQVVVICGPGNNGGDGLVVTRQLLNQGYDATAVILDYKDGRFAADNEQNQRILRSLYPERVIRWHNPSQLTHDLALLSRATIVVDAIFGTGVNTALAAPWLQIVEYINSLPVPVYAVDIPSGVVADSGQVLSEAVSADFTGTLAACKQAQFLFPGGEHYGQTRLFDIGFWPPIGSKYPVSVFDETALRLPVRSTYAHKKSSPEVLVIAGSKNMCGAARLAALAALRSGASLVRLAAPAAVLSAIRFVPELLTLELPETAGGTIAIAAYELLSEYLAAQPVVLIGPGLGRNPETDLLVHRLVENYTGTMVVDADALNAFEDRGYQLQQAPGRLILTPHNGEFKRLLKNKDVHLEAERFALVEDFVHASEAVLVLKGPCTMIADSHEAIVNETGHQGLATAGSGDVLSGMIAAFVTRGGGCLPAAAVYLHGRCAELWEERHGTKYLIASDLIEQIPAALASVGH